MKSKEHYLCDRIKAAADNERTAVRRVDELVTQALDAAVSKSQIARAMGVSRKKLYASRFNGEARP